MNLKFKKIVGINILVLCGLLGGNQMAFAVNPNLSFTPKLIVPKSPYSEKTVKERESLRDITLAYYYYEDGPNKNLKKAKFWVDQGVKKQNRDSHFLLGLMHFKGDAAVKDVNLALDNLKEAAELDHRQANEMLGLVYYYGIDVPVDFDNAYMYLSEVGSEATPESKTILGKLYYSGDGVGKDYRKAFTILAEAANAGHPEAQAMLSVLYRRGQGVDINLDESYKWLRLATEKSIDARILMGIKYEGAGGVEKDLGESYYYYLWAKEGGSKLAQKYIDKIMPSLTSEQKSKSETRLRAKNSVSTN